MRDTAGQPLWWQGYLLDITERTQIEEALRQSQHDLEDRILERTAQLHQAKEAAESARQESCARARGDESNRQAPGRVAIRRRLRGPAGGEDHERRERQAGLSHRARGEGVFPIDILRQDEMRHVRDFEIAKAKNVLDALTFNRNARR